MTLFDDLIAGFGGQEAVSSGTSTLAPFIVYLALAVVIIIGGFLILRWLSKKVHYRSEGQKLFPVRIVWEDKYGGIEGYLSKVEIYTEEIFDELEQQEGLKTNREMLKQLVLDGHINTYFLNITDESDIEDSLNKTYILSPFKLEDMGWDDQKGKRYIYSMLERIRRRNLFFLKESKRFTVTNPDNKEEDWWIISPKPKGETKSFMGYKADKNFEPLQHNWTQTILEGGRKLAEHSSFTKHLAEALQQNTFYKQQSVNFENLYNEKVEQLLKANTKISKYKFMLTQKPYVISGTSKGTKAIGVNFAWIIGGIFLSWMLSKIMPDIFLQMDSDSAQILGMIIGIGLIGLAFHFQMSKQKKDAENEEIESEAQI